MKKFISIMLSSLLMTSVPLCVSAAEPVSASAIPQRMAGLLIDDQGNIQYVVGNLVTPQSPSSVGSNTYSATYEYSVYRSSSDETLSVDASDGALSVHAYLTIEYTVLSGSLTRYLLTGIDIDWNLMDSYVHIFDKNIEYVCSDVSVSQHDAFGITYPGHIDTQFDDYITRNSTSALGATLTLHLQMGSSRNWELVLPNYLF